jgi:hypothetical protein
MPSGFVTGADGRAAPAPRGRAGVLENSIPKPTMIALFRSIFLIRRSSYSLKVSSCSFSPVSAAALRLSRFVDSFSSSSVDGLHGQRGREQAAF